MNYFGTSLSQAGHYFWILDENNLRRSRLRFSDIPFNPEHLPIIEKGKRLKGTIKFYNAFEYSILAIEGACSDTRWGTCSIFFIKEIITYEEMKSKLLNIPVFIKIIEKMPFDVKWIKEC